MQILGIHFLAWALKALIVGLSIGCGPFVQAEDLSEDSLVNPYSPPLALVTVNTPARGPWVLGNDFYDRFVLETGSEPTLEMARSLLIRKMIERNPHHADRIAWMVYGPGKASREHAIRKYGISGFPPPEVIEQWHPHVARAVVELLTPTVFLDLLIKTVATPVLHRLPGILAQVLLDRGADMKFARDEILHTSVLGALTALCAGSTVAALSDPSHTGYWVNTMLPTMLLAATLAASRTIASVEYASFHVGMDALAVRMRDLNAEGLSEFLLWKAEYESSFRGKCSQLLGFPANLLFLKWLRSQTGSQIVVQ